MHRGGLIFVVGECEIAAELVRHLNELCLDCRVFNNGAAALRAAQHELPSMVVSNWELPDLDAPTLCRRLKNDPRSENDPRCWFLALYDQGRQDIAWEGMPADGFGPDDYLARSATVFELWNRVRVGLRLRQSEECNQRLRHELDNLRLQQKRESDYVQNTTTQLVEIAAELHGEITRSAEMEAEHIQAARTDLIAQAAAGLRHEINNPLFAITGSAEAAQRRLDNIASQVSADLSGLYGCIDRIQRGATRIRQVVDAISNLLMPTTKDYVSGVAILDLRPGEQANKLQDV